MQSKRPQSKEINEFVVYAIIILVAAVVVGAMYALNGNSFYKGMGVILVAIQPATKTVREPKGVDGHLLKVIRQAVDECGEIGTAGPDAPCNAKAVEVETIKTYCRTSGWQQDREPKAFRAVLSRSLSNLLSKDFIGRNERVVWLAR